MTIVMAEAPPAGEYGFSSLFWRRNGNRLRLSHTPFDHDDIKIIAVIKLNI